MEFDTKIQNIKYTENIEFQSEDKNIDGRYLARKTITDDKIQSTTLVADGSITNTKLSTNAVSKSKMADDSVGNAELDIEEITVNVAAGQVSGTGTATSGSIIIGWRPAGNVDQLIDNISISGTTITVSLAAAATNQNQFVIILLKS